MHDALIEETTNEPLHRSAGFQPAVSQTFSLLGFPPFLTFAVTINAQKRIAFHEPIRNSIDAPSKILPFPKRSEKVGVRGNRL